MQIAWTGHRPDLFMDQRVARNTVFETAGELQSGGSLERFLVGGQRGVDTWAAEAAHTLDVPFSVLLPLPVPDFTADWTAQDRVRLERTLAWASEVVTVDADPADAYTERNRRLALLADLLVAVWTRREGGGTAETVAFARQYGTPLREIVLEPSRAAHSVRGRGI
jgi:hypothetical protein